MSLSDYAELEHQARQGLLHDPSTEFLRIVHDEEMTVRLANLRIQRNIIIPQSCARYIVELGFCNAMQDIISDMARLSTETRENETSRINQLRTKIRVGFEYEYEETESRPPDADKEVGALHDLGKEWANHVRDAMQYRKPVRRELENCYARYGLPSVDEQNWGREWAREGRHLVLGDYI